MPVGNESPVLARLDALGLALPTAPQPLGQYVAAVVSDRQLVLSGMLPLDGGRLSAVGRIGEGVSVEAGRALAERAALNALAVALQTLGRLDRVRGVTRATVFMATAPAFTAHAAVADGASAVFAALFESGHTRVAVGAYTLPMGAPVVLDVTFDLHQEEI